MRRARPSSPLNGRMQLQDERHSPAGLSFPKDSRTALPCLRLSPRRLAKYQAALLEQDDVVISPTSALNPTTLLPISKSGELHRDCLTTIKQAYSSRPDLRDKPLPNAEPELFTDGSGFTLEGRQKAGYAANLSSLHRYLNQETPIPLDTPVHPFQPGDTVYVRTGKDEPLKEKQKEPYTVLLKTYTALKVNGIDSWIRYTRVKKAPDQDKWISMPTGELKLRLTRDCR
ncbi:uncharacterized protein [Ciconia boyciana]|uniref:uncharacterized protein isoform X3 n=1 Tax=Ciconia boyciana TaxID=52775 RepID=UPI003BA0B5E2